MSPANTVFVLCVETFKFIWLVITEKHRELYSREEKKIYVFANAEMS